jgi:hypothetical protein
MQARIRQTCLFAVVALGLVVVLAGAALAQSLTSGLGTWKLNVAKSNYSAGTAPRSATFTVVAAGAGIKATVDSVTAGGTVLHWGFTANYDGKDYVITGDNSYGDDGVALTRINGSTVKVIYKKGGTVTTTQTNVVSSDGKTTTITGTGTNAQGQAVTTVRVYDKQ